jgi:uncharacterized protein GlcG (DUF336 family)
MNNLYRYLLVTIITVSLLLNVSIANAACSDLTRSQFKEAAKTGVSETNGFGFQKPMWLVMVDETGKVCHVLSTNGETMNKGKFAGNTAWLGSRVIAAQKAFTANAFSLDDLALSTGYISATVYPAGSLYGLQHSNPVDTAKAYKGPASFWGTGQDPMVGKRIGGVNVFGGGVALYDIEGVKIGAVGASGDTSCRDHAVAYRTRIALTFNNQPNDDGLTYATDNSGVPDGLGEAPACGVVDPTTNAWDDTADDYGWRDEPT